MKRDKLNRKLAEFDRLFKNYYEKSFELQKTEVMRIEQEVRKIVNECHEKAKQVINDHREELIRIATALIEYETLTAEQIDKVVKGESIANDFTDKQPKAEEPKEDNV